MLITFIIIFIMVTTSTVSYAINNFYSRVLLERAKPLLVHAKFAQVRDIPKNNTNIIKFRKYGALTTNTTPLTEGTTPSGTSLSVSDITATVRQYGDFITLSDVLQMTTLDPILTETAELLGEQAGESLDEIIRDVLVAGTNVQYSDASSPKVNNARNSVTSADVVDATDLNVVIRTMKINMAKPITSMVSADTGYNTTPVAASYIGIVHPRVTYTLSGLTGFEPVEKYAGRTTVLDGEVGKYKELRFIETTKAKVFAGAGSGSIDVYASLFIGQNAYGISRISGEAMKNIVKAVGSAGTADPLNQRSTSGWKATLAALILNQAYILRLESAVA